MTSTCQQLSYQLQQQLTGAWFPQEFITDKPVPWSSATLTRWGRVTHICVGNLTIIGSENGLSSPGRNIVDWTPRNILQWNVNRNSYIFIQVNPFENVVGKMAAILSRPQCVKSSLNLARYGFAVPNDFSLRLNAYHCVYCIPYSETHCRRHLQIHLLNTNLCALIAISL